MTFSRWWPCGNGWILGWQEVTGQVWFLGAMRRCFLETLVALAFHKAVLLLGILKFPDTVCIFREGMGSHQQQRVVSLADRQAVTPGVPQADAASHRARVLEPAGSRPVCTAAQAHSSCPMPGVFPALPLCTPCVSVGPGSWFTAGSGRSSSV